MGVLQNYNPKNVMKYFEEICAIPHGSGNTDAIADYLVKFANDHGFWNYRDAANNVVIRKPASKGYEKAETIILQGHHDMVCEKDEGLDFNFETDPIVPVVDGDWIRTNGTTLGGDNGIAVAMILAILDDDTLAHPAIEGFITADEEAGLIGAFAFDCSVLTGHKFINLDSEYEGVLMCSCAGGVNAHSTIPVEREAVAGTIIDVKIAGLCSGHSGVEIDKGRANSNVLVGRILNALSTIDYNIVAMEGGTRETAIAAVASLKIAVEAAKAAEAKALIEAVVAVFKKEYATTEPNMAIDVIVGATETVKALTLKCTKLVANVILALPDSVQEMSIDMPGLVQTSSNFGILQLKEDELYISNTVRSSMTTQKEWIVSKINAIVTLAGGKCETQGNYPGWAYNPNSVVKDTILECWEKLTGNKATVEAVHAGIECGLFADSIPNLDCVSIGPTMADVHTPREHLSIASTERTYELLKMVLAASK